MLTKRQPWSLKWGKFISNSIDSNIEQINPQYNGNRVDTMRYIGNTGTINLSPDVHGGPPPLKPYIPTNDTITVPLSICVENPNDNVMRPTYLDNQATTPLDPRVLDKMLPYMVSQYGNPHSRTHLYGWEAERAVEAARESVGTFIGAKRPSKEIIWTSGATECNNMAIKGVALHHLYMRRDKGDKRPVHIVTTQIEHKCVLASCRDLVNMYPDEITVTYLPVGTDGLLDPKVLESAIVPGETVLASVIGVHNEIGVIQDLKALSKVCKSNKVVFHSDIAQAVGKIKIDVVDMGIDIASISGHKLYGPRGVGALYINSFSRPRIRLSPQISGGGQERGLRSGTLPSYLTIGMGKAVDVCKEEMENDSKWVTSLSDYCYNKLKDSLPGIILNGSVTQRYPGNLNISFDCVEGESLLMSLRQCAALSSGSACTSASLEPSYVLRAIGVGDDLAHTSLRFGFGRFTTKEEVENVTDGVISAVTQLRELSPLWELKQLGISTEGMEWT